MKCPKCEKELEARFNIYQVEDGYVEVFLDCENQHQYFVRIEPIDLIED